MCVFLISSGILLEAAWSFSFNFPFRFIFGNFVLLLIGFLFTSAI